MKRRVVVTGIGVISPIGNDVSSMWKNLISCKSGIKSINSFDTSDLSSKIAGYVQMGEGGFNPDDYMTPMEQKKVDKFIIFALAAAQQAWTDSGFEGLSPEQKENVAVSVGSGIGGVSRLYDTSVTLHNEGARRVSPFFIPSVLVNLASGHIAIKYGLKGTNYGVVSACASGTHSIGEAFRAIRDGYYDFALAGGAEAAVCRLGVAGFAAARALSTHFNETPHKASRPWDKGRDGFVVGEGAAVLTLETLDSAKSRGAKIYGEIVGYGASCDAYHITAPDASAAGAMRSMHLALNDANLSVDAIDYINAHGTSTPQGDMAELKAVKAVFKDHVSKLNMSSTKSSMGHLLGAAGAVESVICLQALNSNIVPATINLDDPEDDCAGVNLTPNIPQEKTLNCVMSNSFGFGGTNGTLIFKKFA